MAVKTLYVTNNLASVHQELSETTPGAEAFASPVTGWVVSTGAGPDYASFRAQTEVAANQFSGTAQPDGSIDTANGDCWRTANTYSGNFASGNWTITLAARANTLGGAQDGRARFRLFKGANADGTGATEITGAVQIGSGTTNLDTGATQASSVTFNPGAFSVLNEYLFIQVGWERTGAGGMTTADVNLRIGTTTGSMVVTADFTATNPPAITSAGTATGTQGVAFSSYTITATNSPTSFGATNLPAGLSVNTGTGAITGTPTTPGVTVANVTATNADGTDNKDVTFTINPPAPVVTSSGTAANGQEGVVYAGYQITATNSPTSYGATGLPPGLSVNAGTGAITGTPTTAGTYNATVSATNVTGTGDKAVSFEIIIGVPVITSSLTANGSVGAAFSYQITATKSPTSYNAVGLPAGLSINTSTGEISGAPDAGGVYSFTIQATNAGGTGSATLVLTVPVPSYYYARLD